MTREQLFRLFFLGVLFLLIYEILHILSPFYTGILGAIVLVLLFYPMHRFVLEKTGPKNPNVAAGLSTLSVMVLIVLPFLIFTWLLFHELSTIQPVLEKVGAKVGSWRKGEGLTDIFWLSPIERQLRTLLNLVQIEPQRVITKTTEIILGIVAGVGKKLPRHIIGFAINMLVIVFTLFFLFRDGRHLFHRAKDLIPMDPKHKDNIVDQLYLTVTAVVRGIFLVAATQGILAGIGYFIAGVPSPIVLGALTIFFALIPLVGPVSVWLPMGIYYWSQGSMGKAIFLLIWGALVVSLADNFLRPILIGTRAKLPFLFLFFSLLGGIKIYGAMGLFLGPLVVALGMAFVKIYREEYTSGGTGLLPRQDPSKKT